MAPMSVCCQVKDLFKELQVECNVVELDLIGKIKSAVSLLQRHKTC